jgi:hypothetical protein
MGGWGIFASLPTLLVVPSIRALFISLIMATNITNFGVINYNDHHKEVNINAENSNTAEIIRAFMNDNEIEDIQPEITNTNCIPIPQKGKYSEVRKYIEERKRSDEEFKQFCQYNSRRALCERLSKEFGWFVDEHSLGVNISRNA